MELEIWTNYLFNIWDSMAAYFWCLVHANHLSFFRNMEEPNLVMECFSIAWNWFEGFYTQNA